MGVNINLVMYDTFIEVSIKHLNSFSLINDRDVRHYANYFGTKIIFYHRKLQDDWTMAYTQYHT